MIFKQEIHVRLLVVVFDGLESKFRTCESILYYGDKAELLDDNAKVIGTIKISDIRAVKIEVF